MIGLALALASLGRGPAPRWSLTPVAALRDRDTLPALVVWHGASAPRKPLDGYRPVALSPRGDRLLLYETGVAAEASPYRMAVAGGVRPLPQAAVYGFDAAGGLLRLTYEGRSDVVARDGRIIGRFRRAVPYQALGTYDRERIVAAPGKGGLVAFGADSGQPMNYGGEEAIATTVFRPGSPGAGAGGARIVRRLPNSTPMGFADARTLVVQTRVPFTMDRDDPVFRVVDIITGRRLAEFSATTVAIEGGAVVALFSPTDDSRCRRAAFAYPPARQGEQIEVAEAFDISDGDFVRVRLAPAR